MDWRTARSTLIKTISTHSLRMAAIAKGEYTSERASSFGPSAVDAWNTDNLLLSGIVFRTIKPDTKEGIALRSQIVQLQDAERRVIDDNSGIAVIKFLDERDAFRSAGEKREGAADLKKMQMTISMTAADVDQFVANAYNLYCRCTGDQLAEMGNFQDVLLAK